MSKWSQIQTFFTKWSFSLYVKPFDFGWGTEMKKKTKKREEPDEGDFISIWEFDITKSDLKF